MELNRETLYRFISKHKLAVISTVSPSGLPQAAVVGFAVTADLELIFDTVKESRKYANLRAKPDIAAVIGWDDEVTVQYEGRADELRGAEHDHFRETYFAAWPDGRDRLTWTGIVHFLVSPKWIRFSDFNQATFQVSEITL